MHAKKRFLFTINKELRAREYEVSGRFLPNGQPYLVRENGNLRGDFMPLKVPVPNLTINIYTKRNTWPDFLHSGYWPFFSQRVMESLRHLSPNVPFTEVNINPCTAPQGNPPRYFYATPPLLESLDHDDDYRVAGDIFIAPRRVGLLVSMRTVAVARKEKWTNLQLWPLFPLSVINQYEMWKEVDMSQKQWPMPWMEKFSVNHGFSYDED